MRRSSIIKALGLSVVVLALSTGAGIAYAASERYDSAKDNIAKAIALLKAIENPDERQPEKIHRELAIKALETADQQIDKAKAAADKTPKKHEHDHKKGKKDFKHKKDK